MLTEPLFDSKPETAEKTANLDKIINKIPPLTIFSM